MSHTVCPICHTKVTMRYCPDCGSTPEYPDDDGEAEALSTDYYELVEYRKELKGKFVYLKGYPISWDHPLVRELDEVEREMARIEKELGVNGPHR